MPIKPRHPVNKVSIRTSPEKSKFGLLVGQIERIYGYKVVAEHKFLENRRFRFDFACVELKVYWEYEGIISGKSRHTTLKGYTGDCSKYNLASINGWVGFRYTAMNYADVLKDFEQYIKNK